MEFPNMVMLAVTTEMDGTERLEIIPDGELVDYCDTGDIIAFYELKFKQVAEKTVTLKETK